MPQSEADRVKEWTDRLLSANKLYNKWSDRFRTNTLEQYYLGEHYAGKELEDIEDRRYVINLVYSTIEVNKPSLIFHRPQVRIQARPGRSDDFGSEVDVRARTSQDVVQTAIDDPDLDFDSETVLSLHEAHFRFGVTEVGYTADWIDNPNAGKPLLKEGKKEGDPDAEVRDKNGAIVQQGARVINEESIYIKRIPADTFRVSLSNKNSLKRNDWVAYYEWHYVEDVKRNKSYKGTAGLKATGTVSNEIRPDDAETFDAEELGRRHGMVKIWKIWDLRGKVRHVIAEDHKKFLIEGQPFKTLPFAILKFHEVLNQFYPMPPVFQWIGPQDEINETRESQRAHRRRFYRRYTRRKGAIDDSELEKLMTGGDGVVAESNVEGSPLVPVPDAPMSGDTWRGLDEAKVDFLAVSGIGGDQRGVAESETATQASIIDVRSRLRETSARNTVAKWLAGVSRLILLTIRENYALPFWIQATIDPVTAESNPEELVKSLYVWKQITSEAIGDNDFDVFIDLASMSPVTEDIQRNSWNQVLALLTNPQILMILAMSEVLLRKTLSLYGIRAETEIREIQKIARTTMMMVQQAAQAEAEASVAGGGPKGKGGGGLNGAARPTPGPSGANGVGGEALAAPPEIQKMLSGLSEVGKEM